MDNELVLKQKEIFKLFYFTSQVNPDAEYYKIGHAYDIEANIDNYTVSRTMEILMI